MNATVNAEQSALAIASPQTGSAALILNAGAMEQLYRFAEMMAEGNITVPKHFQGNVADCLAVSMQAAQWGMNPFAVAQKTHVVNGTLGYEAQLVNAVLQSMGAIRGEFSYEHKGEGDALETRVGATIAGNKQITWGEFLCIAKVTTKNSPLWKTNPKQQMGYLQVKNWGRAYCPGPILGVYTTDELGAVPAPNVIDPGTGEIKPATPATYPDEKFAANLPKYTKLIAGGKQTVDAVIATIESNGAPLTQAQKDTLKAIKPATDAGPKITFAEVADKIAKATNADELNTAGDLIKEVPDNAQKTELRGKYDDRAAQLATAE